MVAATVPACGHHLEVRHAVGQIDLLELGGNAEACHRSELNCPGILLTYCCPQQEAVQHTHRQRQRPQREVLGLASLQYTRLSFCTW